MVRRLDARDPDFATAFDALVAGDRDEATRVDGVVAEIIEAVRQDGDTAVCRFTERFDRLALTPSTIRVTNEEIAAATDAIDPDLRQALDLAAGRIEAFHATQVPQPVSYTDAAGVCLGSRWTAVHAAGVYVPGGQAAYPSSVLMNAIPARVAGVDRLVMVVPAPDGVINPLVLAAARTAGVDEVYRIGGAQAIAALAYGTATIRPVDVITGPGNAYVAAAKKQVFGVVGIDMIAGPSEVLIVADGTADPETVAIDLMSQAEHDAAAQAILITTDHALADTVAQAVDTLLERLPRGSVAGESWRRNGAIIEVGSLTDAIALIDRLAPEHLELAVSDPDLLLERVRNAGAIFLGHGTPEALGDYVAGTNHVLPTARSARFASGLGVLDFMKRTSIVGCGEDGLRAIGPAAVRLARAEGLEAHALSIERRLGRNSG